MVSLVVVVCFSLFIVSSYGLTCFPCDNVSCPPVESYDCPKGVVKSGCECCHQCAKVQGEQCGGSFDVNGKCAEDLVCVRLFEDRLFGWQGKCMTSQEAKDFRSSPQLPLGVVYQLLPLSPVTPQPVTTPSERN